MPYNQLEDRYLNSLAELDFPTMPPARLPEVVVTGEPEPPAAGGPAGLPEPRFGRGGVTKAQAEAAGGLEKPAMALADTLAGALRGTVAQSLGLPGDIESLVRLLTGGEQVLPTTERVSEMLPPVVPPGAPDAAARQQTAEIAGKLGEFNPIVGAPEAVKLGVKGAKAAGKALAPKAGEMLESYLTKTGAVLKVAPDAPAIEVSAAPKPSTPAFKKWFADSKVVDDKGQPIVMYHGTPANIEQFKRGRGNDRAIFVSPDPKFAGSFAGAEFTMATGGTPNVIPLYVRALNPFDFDNPNHRAMVIDLAIQEEPIYRTATDQEGMRRVLNDTLIDKSANWSTLEGAGFQKAIKALGFDSFYVREEGIKNLAVYNPEQLKSVFNKGTFDPKDPRILHGGGAVATGAATQGEEKK